MVLSYYDFSDLIAPVETITLSSLPADIAWPDGDPLYLFDAIDAFSLRVRCMEAS